MRNTERAIRWRIPRRLLWVAFGVAAWAPVGGSFEPCYGLPGTALAGVGSFAAGAVLADTTSATPAVPQPPEPPDGGGTDWNWKSGWESDDNRDVVRMGENIEIAAGERIAGDVVAIGGKVTVSGHVAGDVVSVGGGLDLRNGCVIEGDAVSVGGVIEREEGAVVRGQDVSVGALPGGMMKAFHGLGYGRHSRHDMSGLKIWWDLLRYLGFLGIAMILYLAFPDRMNAIRGTVRSRFWLSLVTGFGSIIGAMVLLVLLVITCIGILVAVPGVFVTILAVVGGGATAISLLGLLLIRRSGEDRRAWFFSLLTGLAALFVLQALGRVLVIAGGAGEVIGDSIMGIVKLAWTILLFTGLGSLVLSRFGRPGPTIPRPAWEIYNAPPAVPPSPEAPAPQPPMP